MKQPEDQNDVTPIPTT